MAISTLPEVVAKLEEVIDWARTVSSRLGFFAAVYQRVTREIERLVDSGVLADPQKLIRLDIDFANRYLEAFEAHRRGQRPSHSWHVAFAAAANDELLIVQHLLVAISAHINFDLGISAAKIAGTQAGLDALRVDFDLVAQVFARLIDDVEEHIGAASPRFGELDELAGDVDEGLVGFSIQAARERAWSNARVLVSAGPLSRLVVESQDLLVASFGKALVNPILTRALRPIQSAESRTVPEVIGLLARERPLSRAEARELVGAVAPRDVQ